MTTTISGTTGIVTPALDLTTPLPVSEGGTGTSTVKPYRMVLGTPIATTSGTSHDFTSLPTWVKRITVMCRDSSVSGTTSLLIQIGSGSVQTSGYNSAGLSAITAAVPAVTGSAAGFVMYSDQAADAKTYTMIITKIDTYKYVASYTSGGTTGRTIAGSGSGSVTLTGDLDRVRLTTVNGTDTFDAGSFNILYEGYED